ncbi:MAG: hypothetical protein HRU15_06620, partial [Planctomycetes bacterium]|nr:hypothetical protein [Planctomycetota bacterium]
DTIHGSIIGKNGRVDTWRFKESVPSANKCSMHINLWLFKGAAPQKECEVVISRAVFVAAEMKNSKKP